MNQPENTLARPAVKYGLFLLVVTVLVYSATIRFPFIYFDDNFFIVQDPAAHHWSSVPSAFFPKLGSETVQNDPYKIANFYRPIVTLWVVANYKILGLHPMLWRFEVLALYGVCVWLFWRLAYMLTRDDFTAVAAALLFALHPLHVEGVAWLSGAGVELLLCAFFLGGFLAYLRWRETQRPLWLAWCGVLVLLGLLTKETAAALPVLIVAHTLIFRKRDETTPSPRLLPLSVALLAPIAAYTLLRVLAIHSVVFSQTRHSWADVLRSEPLFFSIYLKHVIWPFKLANWYDIQIVANLSWSGFYLPLVICLTYLGLMLWALSRKPLVGFLLLWWVVPLIPAFVGALNFVDSEFIHDRFTFVALGGFCVLGGLVLARLPVSRQSLFGFSTPSVAALATVTAILGVASATLVFTWQSDLTMSAHAVQISPTSVRPRILLGNALQRQKDREDALALYRDTLRLDPNRWETLFAYGTALANDGDRADAFRVLSHGVDVAPSKSAFYLLLADILADAKRFDDASKLLEKGIPVAEHPDLLRAKLAQVQALQQRSANP